MKVYIYSQFQKWIATSGIGRAGIHQKWCLTLAGARVVDNYKDADVVHINTIFPGTPFMAHRARKAGKKVVLHAHSTEEDFRNSFKGSNQIAPYFGKWIRYLYEQGDVVVTPSAYSKRLLEEDGVDKDIYVLSNGIDLDFYTAKGDERNRFRKLYGYGPEDKVIMSVGLWIERKGILDFIELAKSMPEYRFIWFGKTSPSLIPAKVARAIEQAPSNLRFPGYVSREALRDAYFGADLFLFPSYEETEGIVVLEALASKIPVLLRNIPVYKGWLTQGRDVHMARSHDEFAEKAKKILSGEVQDLRENGYKVAQSRSFESIGKRLVDIYQSIDANM